jgi:Predicted flavin-nucleotide-binding protein
MTVYPPSARTTLKRLPERGHYDRQLIHSILDEALICHVGFVFEGKPVVIPTIHVRVEETLYVHGSQASRMLQALKGSADVCITATLLDGLVLARSLFHSSMNYPSVVVFGIAREVTDPAERLMALDAIVEHVAKGRSADARKPNEAELRKTMVIAVRLEEVSAKVRAAGVGDEEEDYALPVWAGVLPLRLTPGEPIPDERLVAGVEVPEYVKNYRR